MPNLDHEALATLVEKGATCCHFKKNQIILYDSHVPVGIFVITTGEVLVYRASRKTKTGIEQHVACGKNILVLPEIKELYRKSSIRARALRNCKALFIPKSIILSDKSLYSLIEAWVLNRAEVKHASSPKIDECERTRSIRK